MRARIFISVEPKDTELVADALRNRGMSVEVVDGAPHFDILADVAARDLRKLKKLVSEKIAPLKGVRAIEIDPIVQSPPLLPTLRRLSSVLFPISCGVFVGSALRLIPLEPTIAAAGVWFATMFALGIRIEQVYFRKVSERSYYRSASKGYGINFQ